MHGGRQTKEGLLYHKTFVYEGEYGKDYVPHGTGVCHFATGEVLVGSHR